MKKKELKLLLKTIASFVIGFLLFIIGIQFKNNLGDIFMVLGVFIVSITFVVIFYMALVSEELTLT